VAVGWKTEYEMRKALKVVREKLSGTHIAQSDVTEAYNAANGVLEWDSCSCAWRGALDLDGPDPKCPLHGEPSHTTDTKAA
jgi:hypothetical protein